MSLSPPQSVSADVRVLNLPLPYALAGALFLAACAWQIMLGVNPDTTWLTMMAERWLGGDRPYVDVHDTNPPASIYLYMPAAVIARLTGIRSEYVVQFLVFALFAGCMVATARIARRSGYDRYFRMDWLAPVCVVLFLLMPSVTFAQREHIAAMLTLPVIAVGAVRAAGKDPDAWMIALSGVAIGVAASIKPPLASIAVFISAVVALHRRSWSPLFAPENFIGAGMVFVYIAAVLAGHPEFMRDVAPQLKDVYLPNAFFALLIILPAFYAMVMLFAHSLLQHRGDWVTAPTSLVYAAAAAYFVSYIVQVKFFDYHALPVTIFLCLAICMGVLRVQSDAVVAGKGDPARSACFQMDSFESTQADRFQRGEHRYSRKTGIHFFARCSSHNAGYVLPAGLRVLSLAVVVLLGFISAKDFYSAQYNGNLTKAIRSVSPSAKVMGFNVMQGWQLGAVRDAGGRWVGSFGCNYVPGYVDWYRKSIEVSPEWNRRLEHWEQWVADVATKDLVDKRPDVVLVRNEKMLDWLQWMKRYPKLQSAMESYKFYRTVDNGPNSPSVRMYVRR